ncbi:hypothetical protein E2C01_056797 [Portunus trituberculatus]|uniref:Uncharacterized protein n=1 Tax=Portunus trituberculatus TaxID=210409 RepID=A0A5B7H0K0_PORTR|nr:hypothetical protein [Portunus trituberculatus]
MMSLGRPCWKSLSNDMCWRLLKKDEGAASLTGSSTSHPSTCACVSPSC